jgi:hypothetical protein
MRKENQILINIESSKDDLYGPEELERITYNLRDDLAELDFLERIDLVTKEGGAPKHSKSGTEVTLGSLLVTLGGSVASNVIPNLQILRAPFNHGLHAMKDIKLP